MTANVPTVTPTVSFQDGLARSGLGASRAAGSRWRQARGLLTLDNITDLLLVRAQPAEILAQPLQRYRVGTDTTRLTAALADRYRIERELGAGGMATVYLAQDLRHDRKVAIKVLRPELGRGHRRRAVLSEIKTTANLQHPHILAALRLRRRPTASSTTSCRSSRASPSATG